jgi:hypothetical protein
MQDCDGTRRTFSDKIIDILPWIATLGSLAYIAWLVIDAAQGAQSLLAH